MSRAEKILVDAVALKQVLRALNGPPHLMRELQFTRQPVDAFPDNPINILIRDYNNVVKASNAK